MNEEILKLLNEMLNEDLDLQGITDSVTKIKAIIKNSVILSKNEYDDLYNNNLKLAALEAAGVDNWEFYDCAQDILEEWGEEMDEEDNEKREK